MNEMPWSAVLRACLEELGEAGVESVPRAAALARILRESIVADRDYPTGTLSTMDGYALEDARQTTYRVVGENTPGHGSGAPLEPGTARRIFTGAQLPANASRVVPQEMTTRDGDLLAVTSFPDARFLRIAGSEAKVGSPVLHPGTRIGPVEQSLLATVGASHVLIAKKPRVVHIVTGDELADPDTADPGLLIRDSNSDLVRATLAWHGFALTAQLRIGDDRVHTFRTVTESAEGAELLLISGGASVGDHDHARAALEAAGFRIQMHRVNIRPGKPVGIARRGDTWAVMLPGNPVSHLVSLHLFVLPLLRGLEGETSIEPEFMDGVLGAAVSADTPARATLWPASASLQDGAVHLLPRRFLSSGDLIGVAGVNALILFPAGDPIPSPGARVRFLPLHFRL